jgi:hypothetical protein
MKDLLITVPYRNREEHLEKFLNTVPQFFTSRNITFDIVICELSQGGDWNAGLCNNSIIHFLNNVDSEYKYIYIHHVDIYPVSGQLPFPEENECIYNLGDYGSCILPMKQFLECKGFGNCFWGWGSEDNNFYNKLSKRGVKITDFSKHQTGELVFDTGYQNHIRAFQGKNYAHNVKNLYKESEDDSINGFYKYASVNYVEKITDNVYKQLVTPSNISPRQHVNDKVVIMYVEHQTKFEYIATAVKSGIMHAGYNYDIVVFVANESPESNISHEVIAHGAISIPYQKTIDSKYMAGIERFYAYKKFISENTQYKEILHVDAADVLFLHNPFDVVDKNKINFTQEDIFHKNQKWNLQGLGLLKYPTDIINSLLDMPVICSGVIYAPAELFSKLMDCVISEFETKNGAYYHGIDQPIINKLIYADKIFNEDELSFKTTYDNFCINLHVPLKDTEHYYGKPVSDGLALRQLKNYSIIHQYNRSVDMERHIQNFHLQYFQPIIKD